MGWVKWNVVRWQSSLCVKSVSGSIPATMTSVIHTFCVPFDLQMISVLLHMWIWTLQVLPSQLESAEPWLVWTYWEQKPWDLKCDVQTWYWKRVHLCCCLSRVLHQSQNNYLRKWSNTEIKCAFSSLSGFPLPFGFWHPHSQSPVVQITYNSVLVTC